MATAPLDPKFPDYWYTQVALTSAFERRTGSAKVATLFVGEWVKVLDSPMPSRGRAHVRYRGGEGYVDVRDLGRERNLEVYFLDVGQGDSILIQTPDDRRVLIDGGATSDAHQFIRNKYRLDKPDNFIDFDALVLTHSDADHAGGVIPVLCDPKIAVKRIYHNGLFPGVFRRRAGRVTGLTDLPDCKSLPELMRRLVAAIETARERLPGLATRMRELNRRIDLPAEGFVCRRIDSADGFVPPFNESASAVSMRVLWPTATTGATPSYSAYGASDGKTVNGNSVTVQVQHGKNTMLLAGDLNTESMVDLVAARGVDLSSNVFKAAHHGSADFDLNFLRAVAPDVGVISSGDDQNDQFGHPRAVLLGTITRYSKCERPAVFSTELSGCFTALAGKDRARFNAGDAQLYEKAISGIVHVRSDGNRLCVGRVFGRRAPSDGIANRLWKWDLWPA